MGVTAPTLSQQMGWKMVAFMNDLPITLCLLPLGAGKGKSSSYKTKKTWLTWKKE
jgi:hypothetical protein